ncbi:MAG TPA: DUF1616 domain-containing protein [Methanocella sp.]|nr:DUF1616 domain-containing protein [Methanocella sp.]
MVYKDVTDVTRRHFINTGAVRRAFDGAFADLYILSGLFLAMLVFVYAPYLNGGVARFVLGVAAVLIVPGYMFIAAVYPRKSDISKLERLLLAVTFSIILVPMACLPLNYTPWGIRLNTALAVISSVTAVFTAAAFARRITVPKDRRFTADLAVLRAEARALLLPSTRKGSDVLLSLLLMGSVLLVAGVVTYAAMQGRPVEKYTELYISGIEGSLNYYPSYLPLGVTAQMYVKVSNFEGDRQTYDLMVNMDDGGPPYQLYEGQVAVDPGQSAWENITLKAGRPYQQALITVSLFKDGNRQDPYRQCYMWVNATAPADDTTGTGQVMLNRTDKRAEQ